jgi:hypothetical protein
MAQNDSSTYLNLKKSKGILVMIALAMTPMIAAAGWSMLYLLCGGGIGGAILIFIVLKAIGR